MKLLFLIATFLFSSCATKSTSVEGRDLEQLYQGAGVERYFLPDLPEWANFSSSSSCQRSTPIKFLNFSTLKASYSLSYQNLIHFQHMLNRRFELFRSQSDQPLYLKDEAFIFYNVYEQVAGGSKDFVTPNFDRVSLVWIDPHLNSLEKVDSTLNKEEVGKGHPVLVSACLNTKELEKLSEKKGWDRFGVKHIGSEMFSPYDAEVELGHDYSLNFSKFLPNKALYLFAPYKPKHFKGMIKLINN
ncbi:MAG: hypothetical protein CME64_01115 [Halobacteriovoraceae bacterium]|nr:hypothetical protein [Halobacteriovoraceae bacterium]|tara:strand:- start:240764 stop:241495 length:732 start_codon:yes stop_codon:yes gene_type:complete